jgi:hypothetical protein
MYALLLQLRYYYLTLLEDIYVFLGMLMLRLQLLSQVFYIKDMR